MARFLYSQSIIPTPELSMKMAAHLQYILSTTVLSTHCAYPSFIVCISFTNLCGGPLIRFNHSSRLSMSHGLGPIAAIAESKF